MSVLSDLGVLSVPSILTDLSVLSDPSAWSDLSIWILDDPQDLEVVLVLLALLVVLIGTGNS